MRSGKHSRGFALLGACALAAGLGASCGSEGGSEDAGGGASAEGGQGGGSNAGGGSGGGGTAPLLLSETGLFASGVNELAEGVLAYSPRFELWSDGATKRRFVKLPEGSVIDTSDPDFWVYPIGTKLWKEFSVDGVRVETRYLEKRSETRWWRVSYVWKEDESDAEATPAGLQNARGTEHDVPSSDECLTCHSRMADEVLGFNAIQLAHEDAGLNLGTLESSGRLSVAVGAAAVVPGSPLDQAALGVLHANCGFCHHEGSGLLVSLDLWLRVGAETVEATPTYGTTVGVPIEVTDSAAPGATLRVEAGSPGTSALILRMSSRGESWDMPPLGTEAADTVGVESVGDWISAL